MVNDDDDETRMTERKAVLRYTALQPPLSGQVMLVCISIIIISPVVCHYRHRKMTSTSLQTGNTIYVSCTDIRYSFSGHHLCPRGKHLVILA
jgi:hypothetical protein